MKIVRIFGVVLALHVVGGILFIQPGCQSQPRPDAAATIPATGQPAEKLDWEEWDEGDRYVTSDRPRSTPQRPASQPSDTTASAGGVLQPLPSGLEPLPASTESSRQSSGGSYTVRAGDSLWLIANRHNVSLSALLSANNLTEDSVIRPGQELRLPAGSASSGSTTAASSSSPRPSGTTTYTVRSGDSLSVIARRHNTTVQDLKALNNMTSDVIRVDQRLVVPERGEQTTGASAPAVSRTSAPAGSGTRHTVQSGETPGGIAAKYGVSVNDLMSANNISDPRRMRLGQELIIPGASSSSSSSSAAGSATTSTRTSTSGSTIRSTPPSEPVREPARAPAPRDIPVISAEEDEDDDFPIIPIIPAGD